MLLWGLLWELKEILNSKAPNSHKHTLRAALLELFVANNKFSRGSLWTDLFLKYNWNDLRKNNHKFDVWGMLNCIKVSKHLLSISVILYADDTEPANGRWSMSRFASSTYWGRSMWERTAHNHGALAL